MRWWKNIRKIGVNDLSDYREKKERKLQYDLLRILAAFSVVMLHSSAQFWYELDVTGVEWTIANAYDAVFRFGVPIFVMISGALFLDRDYKLDIGRLYRHNILRMVIIYVVWCCLYGLFDSRAFDLQAVGVKALFREMLGGRYHLWFLPMIVGIYVLLPVLKSWVEHADKKNLQYFLAVFFVMQVCSETIRALTVTDEIHYILNLANVEMACGYIGYFVWGYYLAHIGIGDKLRKGIYLMVVPSILLNIVLSTFLSRRAGTPVGTIYDSFGVFTFVIVTACFLVVKDRGSKASFGRRSSGIIKELSADTLGVYVIHVGLMEFLKLYGIHSMMLPNIFGIPVYGLFCFGICLLVAAIVRRIPVIGKYIC